MWHSADVNEIPPITAAPNQECLAKVDSFVQIIFDVETTSLGNYNIGNNA